MPDSIEGLSFDTFTDPDPEISPYDTDIVPSFEIS